MTARTLRLVLAVVAVLTGLYLITAVYRGIGEGSGDAGDLPEAFASLSDLEPDAVEAITILPENRSDSLRIRRSGGDWSVNELQADSARVERLLADLLEADYGGVIARNPANHAGLGVSQDSAVIVRLETGSAGARQLLVGDAGPAYPSAYVRIDGADAVHVFESDLSTSVRQTLDQWRNRVVASVDTARVQRLEVTGAGEGDGSGGDFVVEREADGWSLIQPGAAGDDAGAASAAAPADPTAVRRALGGLRRLMAQGFAAEGEGDGQGDGQAAGDAAESADAAARSLVALDAEGDTLAALAIAGADDDASFRVRARGDSVLYRVSRFDVGRLLPDPSTLAADATDADDPDL